MYYVEMHVRRLSLVALHVHLIHFSSNTHMFWVPKHLFYHKRNIFQKRNQSAGKLRELYKARQKPVIKQLVKPKFLVF